MQGKVQIDFNLNGLDKLRKEVGNSYRARIGIIGDKAAQEHTLQQNGERKKFRTTGGINKTTQAAVLTNADIGVIQMFGSITGNIPPRDFLFMPIQSHSKDILKAMTGQSVKQAVMAGEFKKVYGLLGAAALKWVLLAFETSGFGQWPPNTPATIDKKGSAKPLIDTGQLRRAITFDVVGKNKV